MSDLLNFYCLTLYSPLANGLVVYVKVPVKLYHAKTVVDNVDSSNILKGQTG